MKWGRWDSNPKQLVSLALKSDWSLKFLSQRSRTLEPGMMPGFTTPPVTLRTSVSLIKFSFLSTP